MAPSPATEARHPDRGLLNFLLSFFRDCFYIVLGSTPHGDVLCMGVGVVMGHRRALQNYALFLPA